MKTIICAVKGEQRRRRRGDREPERGGGGGGKAVRGKKRGEMEKATLWTCPKRALICLKLTNSILEIRWSDWDTPTHTHALLCPTASSFSSSSSPFESRALKVPNPASDRNTLQGERHQHCTGVGREQDEWQKMEGCETEWDGRWLERRGMRENIRGIVWQLNSVCWSHQIPL